MSYFAFFKLLLCNACTLRSVFAFGDRIHVENLFTSMKSNIIFERLTLEARRARCCHSLLYSSRGEEGVLIFKY